ncbi:MAG: DUF362 domain-containing protein [Clostridia bacterium]|nr:DUF362 domain-containing protein [Clostridia bacterium]
MKNLKSIVVYGIIALLCVVAVVTYIIPKKSGADSSTQAVNGTAVSANDGSAVKVNSEGIPAAVEERMKKSTLAPMPNPIVGAARGEVNDYAKVTREAVQNAGGLKDIIKPGSTVLIKPNMIITAGPSEGKITDYRMVQELANIAKELGAKRIVVADGSPWGKPFDNKRTRYKSIAGVELLDFNDCQKEDCYYLKAPNGVTDASFYIPKIYMDADVVISAAKLKTHFEAIVTLSLKNVFGVPPLTLAGSSGAIGTGKGQLHDLGIENSIVDLNKIRKPDFAIIDGIIGGDGNMPISGSPVDSKIIFAGIDPVAVDTVGLNFMGFTVDDIPHVKLAGEKGLGINDFTKIKVVGADINKIKMSFTRAFSY